MSLSDDYTRAHELHQQGNLQEAEQLYRALLAADPKHADAWHMLGVIAHQADQHEPAIQCIERAIQLSPDRPEYYHNLALVQHRVGRHDVAVQHVTKVLKLDPKNLPAHWLNVQLRHAQQDRAAGGLALKALGNALVSAQQMADAREAFRRALELRPQDVELLNNLGVVSMEAGELTAAVGYYRRAIALRPQVAELHNNLGNALLQQGDLPAAAAAYRAALAIKPNYPKCANNLAVLLIGEAKFEEAITALHAALEFRPDLPELQGNLGVCLKNLGRVEEAMQAYRAALMADSKFADGHHNLGNLFLDLGLLDKAVLAYRQAIQLDPEDADFHQHLALAYKRQGDGASAREALQGALALDPEDALLALRAATLCPMVFDSAEAVAEQREQLLASVTWFRDRMTDVRPVELLSSHAEAPFHAQFLDGDLRAVRTAYADLFAPLFTNERPGPRTGQPRIGFVITKGHEGVFLKSLRGVLQRLNPQLAQLVIIAPPMALPRLERDLAPATIEMIPLPERGDRTLTVIRDAQLDVLYHWEVGTDSLNYFLPMFRLAPVQCTSWGLQQTSGMAQMDYYLSSALVEPAGAAAHYREQLLLADTLLTYQYRPTIPAAAKSRVDFNLADDQHVYTCAQHLGKFHPDFDPLLAQILGRDEQGVFVVTEDRYRVGANLLRQRWRRTLADVVDRIVWLPRLAEDDYRALLAASDVLLDPPHFGGVNSTYDGLALAKPIVTCPSGYHRGRYTLGCYQKMQLLDCAATAWQHYVELAVHLGTDAEFRAATSQTIAAASEQLWEDNTAVTAHEQLFEQLLTAARRA
jgi:protein O-GlcNAc transferase